METISFYRWDSRGRFVDSFEQADTNPIPAQCTSVAPPADIPSGSLAIWVGGGWALGTDPGEPQPVPEPVPFSVTARQCRLELLAVGALSLVPQIIAAIPDDLARQHAEIEWEFASMIERTNPLVEVIRVATGKTSDEIDDMFRRAKQR